MLKSQVRAEEYRAKAAAATAAAASATLENIRERHRQAAIIWTELADAEQARTRKGLAVRSALVDLERHNTGQSVGQMRESAGPVED